jgi:hypothetical protein
MRRRDFEDWGGLAFAGPAARWLSADTEGSLGRDGASLSVSHSQRGRIGCRPKLLPAVALVKVALYSQSCTTTAFACQCAAFVLQKAPESRLLLSYLVRAYTCSCPASSGVVGQWSCGLTPFVCVGGGCYSASAKSQSIGSRLYARLLFPPTVLLSANKYHSLLHLS